MNFGNIQIGTSPDTTNLSSDLTCDSLSIASGDYLYTNGYDIDSAGDITINSTATLDATDDGELDGTIINIAGSWSNSGTFTADDSTVIFDATSTGKTLSGTLTGSSAFNDLTFNGSGGEWTLSNNIKATNLTISAGKLIDNTKAIEIAGNINISRGNDAVSALTSTGTWTMSASGNIKNSGGVVNADYYQDDLYHLVIAESVTATRTGLVYIDKLTMQDNSSIVGNFELRFGRPSTTTDFINLSGSASISGGLTRLFPVDSTTYSQKAFSLNEDFVIGYSTSSFLSMTGNLSVPSLQVYSSNVSNNETTANCLDMNGNNLTVTGDVKIGGAFDAYDEVFAGKIDFGSGTHSIGGDMTIYRNGDLSSIGYFDFGSSSITVNGDIDLENITVTTGTSTVVLAGSLNQSIASYSQSFYNLTITNSSSLPGVTFTDALDVDNLFKCITPSTTLTFTASTTSTLNDIELDGQASGTRIVIRSTSTTAANWNVAASTQTDVSYVSVSYNDASFGQEIDASNGTNNDGGNNTNWLFPSGITISGTVYTAENKSTNIGTDKTVALSINGGSATTVETTTGGVFSFSSVTVATNNTVAIYLDGETEKASLVTQAANDTSDITSLELFTSHIILSHQTAGPMTNTLLATADNVSDTDLLISVDGSSNATFTADMEVWILTGKTYTPGGNVTAAGLDILSTATFSPEANTLTLTGAGTPFAVSGTFNESTSTVIYTGSSATNVAGTTYNNLTLNQSGTTFTSTGATTVKSVLTITAGTFDADDETITLTGTGTPFVVTDTFDSGTSTVKYTGEGNTTIVATTYYNLETKPSGESSSSSSWIVSGAGSTAFNGTYTENGTYQDHPSYSLDSSHWLIFEPTGMLEDQWIITDQKGGGAQYYYCYCSTLPGSGWSVMSGDSPAPTVSAGFSPYTYTFASGTVNIEGNYVNGDGTNAVNTTADTNDPTFNINGNFTNSADATFVASNSGSFSVASNFTNNSTATLTHSSGTLTLDGQGAQSITTNGDSFNNVTVTNTSAEVSQADATAIAGTLIINSDAIYDINGQNITLATLTNNGTFRLQGGETTVTITTKDTDSGTVEYDGTGTYTSLLYGNSYYNVLFSAAGTFTPAASVTVNNNSTISGATVNLGNNTITYSVTGSFTLNSGAFIIATQGAYRTKLSAGAYSQTGGTYTSGGFAHTNINGNYSVSDGTFTHSNNSYLYISGDYSFSGGISTQSNSGRVYFDGDNNSAINAAQTFVAIIYINKGSSYALTLNCDITVGSFYITSGNINTNAYTITANIDSSNFNANGQTINKLTINGNPVYITGNIIIDTTLTVNSNKSMSINSASSIAVTLTDSVTTTLNGVMTQTSSSTSSYYLLKDSAATTFSTGGTLQGIIKMQADTKDISIPARTYLGRLELINSGSTNRVVTAGTSASQIITIGGSQYDTNYSGGLFLAANGAGNITLEASTYNPDIAITTYGTATATGDIDFFGAESGSEIINAGSGTWTVKGDIDFTSGTFNKDTSTFVLNGTGSLQTQNITSALQSFHNLTIQNNSTNGTIFADSATVTGTFTAITASSKITFDALSTYAFANININGQDSGTHIILQSSDPTNEDLPSRQWYLNVSQTSPQASYVNVTDSDANGGNAITPISSTDGGNNENWLFNISPTEDSLTFINPYGGVGNVAVSDNTTEWTFRALVSDEDGLSDVDYVLLRFANNSDSSSPFDALKYKWTQGSDAFSEEADTLNAASITSTSDDSNGSGNQWTLDFKIKFNDDFASLDTNYSVELVVVDDGAATDSGSYSDIYQVKELSLTLSVDYSTLDFSNLLPGSIATKTTVTTVTCNHPNGYSLAISDLIAGVYSALLHTDLSTRIADYGSGISSPTVWSGTGLGVTVYEATGKDTSKWGTGTTENDLNNKYAGIPETATIIHSKTGSPTANDQTKVGYKVVVPETQKTGYYSGTVTFTATGVLD
ncbi:MAG: hypothetical protein BWY19_00990 [bacterium ADurb.Bin212]|nr:MAG: hypothetical protein BWY19_00990 [bacterium ADurb.Bin212]